MDAVHLQGVLKIIQAQIGPGQIALQDFPGAGAFLTGDDGDGIAAAVAAAGGEAQRHGADNADGKNCFEDLFHNSKLLFDCFL